MAPRHARDQGDRPQRELEAAADRLHSAAIHLLRRLRRQDDRTGISGPRLSALSVLVFGGARTLGELAAAEQVRPPTMTRLVTALEERGLAVREPDPGDGRLTRVRATPAGESLLLAGRARRVGVLARAIAALPASERRALASATDILERLVRTLPEE
jgi:DNA-binding MarR family transcriptional regulator